MLVRRWLRKNDFTRQVSRRGRNVNSNEQVKIIKERVI